MAELVLVLYFGKNDSLIGGDVYFCKEVGLAAMMLIA